MRVFQKFGIPMMGLTIEDFASEGTQLNLGVEPNQIDLLTVIPGLKFDEAWKGHITTTEEGFLTTDRHGFSRIMPDCLCNEILSTAEPKHS